MPTDTRAVLRELLAERLATKRQTALAGRVPCHTCGIPTPGAPFWRCAVCPRLVIRARSSIRALGLSAAMQAAVTEGDPKYILALYDEAREQRR